MEGLPKEIWQLIIQNLDWKSYIRLSLVNRTLREYLTSRLDVISILLSNNDLDNLHEICDWSFISNQVMVFKTIMDYEKYAYRLSDIVDHYLYDDYNKEHQKMLEIALTYYNTYYWSFFCACKNNWINAVGIFLSNGTPYDINTLELGCNKTRNAKIKLMIERHMRAYKRRKLRDINY